MQNYIRQIIRLEAAGQFSARMRERTNIQPVYSYTEWVAETSKRDSFPTVGTAMNVLTADLIQHGDMISLAILGNKLHSPCIGR